MHSYPPLCISTRVLPVCYTHVLVYSLRAGAKGEGGERKARKGKGNRVRFFFLSVPSLSTAGAQQANLCSVSVLFLGAPPK